MKTLRIATRNSPLAMWQAEYVKQRLLDAHYDLNVEIVGMTTKGDVLLDRSLSTEGGKGLFLKELEVSLLNQETDIAVHSMKDVPAELPRGLEIPVVCTREDPRDAFVSNHFQNLYALPPGARIGTSSLRRITQLQSAFPELEFLPLRGNVNTRLSKLDADEYDAIILAAAGLIRLDLGDRISQFITPELCLPAVGQGIVGIECRSDDDSTKALLRPLHDQEAELVLTAERAMNAKLEGGCQAPIAGFAETSKGKLRMRGMVAATDSQEMVFSNLVSDQLSLSSAEQLGNDVAQELLDQGADQFLAQAKQAADEFRNTNPHELSNPVVLVTRQSAYRGNVPQLLEHLGCEVEAIETLQIDPLVDEAISTHFNNLNTFTDIMFVSRNAVDIGMALMQDQNVTIPKSVNVMAVGKETAKQLRGFGIKAMFPNNDTGVEALLRAKSLRDLSNRRILIVRGTHGLVWPAEELRKRGAQVAHADVYEQSLPHQGVQQFEDLFNRHPRISAVFIHSAQSAINFMHLVTQHLSHFENAKMVVGSKRIAESAHEHGWQEEIIVAKSPSNKHMLMAFTAEPSN